MKTTRYWIFLIFTVWILPLAATAQSITVDDDYQGIISNPNVGGGLSHLPDGDLLAFSSDFTNGPALYRIDANRDGNPAGGTKVLAQFDSSVFPDFVQVAPGGTFALAGLSGSRTDVLRIDLTTGVVSPYFLLPGNYDLVFIDDTKAYISANPDGFDPAGANQISLVQLGAVPVITPVVEITGTPSGPVALNSGKDLYYISGTFAFPAPPGSSTLLRFAAADLAQAAATNSPLGAADAVDSVSLDGGYDLVFHRLTGASGELFVSDFSNQLLRIDEPTLTPTVFLTVDDPTFPGLTALSFFQPNEPFDATAPTHAELAVSVALDFFATNKLLQIRPTTFIPAEPAATDEQGFCRPNEPDCINQPLQPSACVGANGFLSQINIASVVNLRPGPLGVTVQYFDASGGLKGGLSSVIGANLKQDFLVNQLGLVPDSVGTVCVTTDGEAGSWTGGIAIYKPDARNGVNAFGDAFDFSLFYPFLNAFRAPVTVSLNTFHLGTDPAATVANWIAITDAERDGIPLAGTLTYFNELGAAIRQESVVIPDGARRDFAGHVAIGGQENRDAIGMAQFVPSLRPGGLAARFYLTVTRYFYDCPGSSCTSFLTAFNLPFRPGTLGTVHGGASTTNGEISIVELNNVSTGNAAAGVQVFAANGVSRGNPQVPVPARATRHLILNQFGQTGFLADNSVSTASVTPQTGYVSATSLFYKLSAAGKLEYGYAAPFAGSPGAVQVSQFNSFISQVNVPEVFNSSNQTVQTTLDYLSFTGNAVAQRTISLPPKNTLRLDLNLAAENYGTVIIQSNNPGIVARNYVRRPGQYTVAFGGE